MLLYKGYTAIKVVDNKRYCIAFNSLLNLAHKTVINYREIMRLIVIK